MQIRLAIDTDRGAWNSYLDAHPEVPPLARFEWRAIFKRAYGVPTYFFLAEEGGTVRGVCATYTTKPWGGKSTLYSLRFGLVVDDETVGQALLSRIQNFCSTQGIGAYLVTSGYKNVSASEPQGERGDPMAMTRKTVVLDLLASEEKMWAALRNKTRNMIRKAQRAGLTVEHGFKNLHAFYDIYARRMLKKGVPIHSLKFFKQIEQDLQECTELLVARYKGKVVGGLWLMFGKRTALYPYQAAEGEGEIYAANQLLLWETMRLCIERGITLIDMGESVEDGGVYRAKVNFGGQPRSVYYYRFAIQASRRPPPIFAGLDLMIKYGPSSVRSWAAVQRKQCGRII